MKYELKDEKLEKHIIETYDLFVGFCHSIPDLANSEFTLHDGREYDSKKEIHSKFQKVINETFSNLEELIELMRNQ